MTDHRVALVVVSHSRALARAAIALAAEMVDGDVRIEEAAGLDDDTLGTDAVRISEVLDRLDGPAGVVVLMDLGSAVLSAELALELLPDPATQDRVVLSPAPLVEGLVVAAVAAAAGLDRAAVAAEAAAALTAKVSHLGVADAPAALARDDDADDGADHVVAEVLVGNAHGLHARPAARLVAEMAGVDASVVLRNLTTGAGPASATSLSQLATLGVLRGHRLEVRAGGPQAREAVDALFALAARSFDEADAPAGVAAPGPAPPRTVTGPVRQLPDDTVDVDAVEAATRHTSPDDQLRRLDEALAAARRQVEAVRDVVRGDVGPEEAGIFDAHLAMLADAHVLGDVRTRVTGGTAAARAWAGSMQAMEQTFAGLPDPYLRARAADVRALAQQVLRAFTDPAGPTGRQVAAPGVLVARDLTPAEAAALDPAVVAAVVLAEGSAVSHAAILARARGVPLVVGAGQRVLELAEGTRVTIDGGSGTLRIGPADGAGDR